MADPLLATCAQQTHDDIGNAARFIRRHGKDVIHVYVLGRWFVWDGFRFRVDETGSILELAKQMMIAIWDEASATSDVKEKGDIATHARLSGKEPRVRAAVTLAATDPAVVALPNSLDREPLLVGVANGVVELGTGQFRNATRSDRITMQLGASWDDDATAPLWLAFLDRVLAGNQALIDFVQRAIGYTLTGLTTEQVLFFLFGHGLNGKSVFLLVLRRLFGDYAAQAAFDSLLERKSDGPRSDLARLVGKRFVAALEVGEGRRLDEGMIKQLTGQDCIVCRHLYGREFEFFPDFKLWLAANHKPTIRGQDLAMWRRILLIPFLVTINEEERDPDLSEKLRGELPGILKWAVEGCLAWQRIGLQPPREVLEATEAYRVESDTIGRFLEEMCELDPSGLTPAKDLFVAYKIWAEENGEIRLSQTAFGRRLSERGFPAQNAGPKKNIVHRVGIRLLNHAFPESSREFNPLFPNSSHVRGYRKLQKDPSNPRQPSESLSPLAETGRVTLTAEEEAEYLARLGAA